MPQKPIILSRKSTSKQTERKIQKLAPSGAQEMLIFFVCLSVCLSDESLSLALNLHLCLSDQSQVRPWSVSRLS